MTTQPITVRVTIQVPINVEAWNDNYGTGTAAKAIRADVKEYVHSLVWEQLHGLGVLAIEDHAQEEN
jgi:hypothetical protein